MIVFFENVFLNVVCLKTYIHIKTTIIRVVFLCENTHVVNDYLSNPLFFFVRPIPINTSNLIC